MTAVVRLVQARNGRNINPIHPETMEIGAGRFRGALTEDGEA